MPEIDNSHSRFVLELMQIGILSYREQESLYQIAQRCAKTAGVSMAGAGLIYGAAGGSITIPGVGTMAGALAGALAGMIGGTVSCTMLNASMKDALRKIASEE